MNSVTITKAQLEAALLQWEQRYRRGECLGVEETAAKTAEQVAAENADHLWAHMAATAEA